MIGRKPDKEKGVRVVFFTNGSKSNTEGLINKNALNNLINHVVSIDSMGQWKPKKAVYQEAIQSAGSEIARSAMIDAHAWDTNGAMNAGMPAGWIRRQESLFHPAMSAPDFESDSLLELVDKVSEPLLSSEEP